MFDGPQRALRCAMSICDAVRSLGIEVRAGLHTGECEVRGDDIGGIAVHIGARVSALAEPNDLLVSSTGGCWQSSGYGSNGRRHAGVAGSRNQRRVAVSRTIRTAPVIMIVAAGRLRRAAVITDIHNWPGQRS
jgi:hypothetical protein